MAIYRAADRWVREWRPPEPGRPHGLPPVHGANVTLRLYGEVIGRGSEMRSAAGTGVVEQAVSQALAEAERRLPVQNDALRDESLAQFARELTISIELAGPLLAIAPERYDNAPGLVSPGLDGVGASAGGQARKNEGDGEVGGVRLEVVFPGTMLQNDLSPRAALSSVVSRVGNDATLGLVEPPVLRTQHGINLYRFRVTHLAQPAPGREPIFLFRGGRVIDTAQLDAAELRRTADRIADHLAARRWPGAEPYGVQGTYLPARDEYEPSAAPADEQALAALALATHARVIQGRDPHRAARSLTHAAAVLRDLEQVHASESPPWDDTAAAATAIVALHELRPLLSMPGLPDLAYPRDLARRCAERTRAGFTPETGFSEDVHAGTHGLVALALVCLAEPGPADDDVEPHGRTGPAVAEAAVRRAFRETPQGDLVSRMPWLGWAEVRLVDLKGRAPGAPASPDLPAAVALRRMRDLLWTHQITAVSAAAGVTRGAGADDRDLTGGIVFTAARNPLPTWQAARPLAFVAGMLDDPRLTEPEETLHELARLLNSLRFLRQLQVDDAAVWMYPNSAVAFGGVRPALWERRLPVDASALTLLTICEALESIESLGKK